MKYEESLTYPTESEEWVKTVVIGGLLLAFSFLLVPMFVAYGYLVRVIRGSLWGESEPPVFEDWGDLLVDGLKAWVIGLVYMFVPLLVATVTVGGALVAFLTGSDAGIAMGIAGLLGGLALSAVLSLVFGYFAVVAVVNFAREDRFGAGFEFGTIFEVATDAGYAVPWLVSVLVFVGVGIVGGVLGVVPIVGAVLTAIATFYASMVAADLWGKGFAAATAPGRREPPVDDHGDVAV